MNWAPNKRKWMICLFFSWTLLFKFNFRNKKIKICNEQLNKAQSANASESTDSVVDSGNIFLCIFYCIFLLLLQIVSNSWNDSNYFLSTLITEHSISVFCLTFTSIAINLNWIGLCQKDVNDLYKMDIFDILIIVNKDKKEENQWANKTIHDIAFIVEWNKIVWNISNMFIQSNY